MRPCVVVADDLTGSCDTGVHFAAAGFETVVCLGPDSVATCPADVVVINTRTRSQPSLEGIFAQLTQQEDPARLVNGIIAAMQS